MKQVKIIIFIFFLSFFNLSVAQSVAYLLDANGLTDTEEVYLLGTLQGIVNRDAPRLFLTNTNNSFCEGANNTLVKYLETQKGFTFIKLKSLNDAVATFATLKGKDGLPLIKGMVKYQPTYWDYSIGAYVNKYYNNWIAANMAAQESLIAVTPKILSHQTQLLAGLDFWYKDTQMNRWYTNFTTSVVTSNGLAITPRAKQGISATRYGCFSSRYVHLDLAVTPKVEIVISDLSPGGSWSFVMGMGSTVDVYNSQNGTKVPGLINMTSTGTFVVDLAATGLFNPTDGRAQLKFCAMTQGTTVTVKSIRFLTATGLDPTKALYVPPRNEFSGLTIKKDLTVSMPYADDEESACAWSVANQRAQCDPSSFAHFPNGVYDLNSLDYVIANKVYIFYQKKNVFTDPIPYSNLDTILSGLKKPASVYGWADSNEDYGCLKMAQYGATYNGGAMWNGSFWKWVPYDGTQLPQSRQVPNLENKVYVNYSFASADYSEFVNTLMNSYWGDPARGSVPMTWGMNTFIAQNYPALMEYFAKTAKPYDSFWIGPSGDGYGHPATMITANMKKYAAEVKRKINNTGVSSAVDFWDGIQPSRIVLNEFTSNTPDYQGVKLMTLLPNMSNTPKTFWLDNGAPIVHMDRGLHGPSQRDTVSTVQSIAETIKAAAAKLVEVGPKFITCNIRFSPTFLKSVKELLPSNFVVVGMPDFIGLAQDAGGMAIVPYSDGVGGGDSLKVSVELHNASGNTGGAGITSWKVPPGWTSTPENWSHGTIEKGGNLKQIVTFKAPTTLTQGGTASIIFNDSRFAWNKELLLQTYASGQTITDCDTTTAWTSSGGASVSQDGNAIKIEPAFLLRRYDYKNGLGVDNNGDVFYPLGNVDFDKAPVLKINIPDIDSNNTEFYVVDDLGVSKLCQSDIRESGVYTLNLKSITKWSGIKSLKLNIKPSVNFGSYLKIQSAKIFYNTQLLNLNAPNKPVFIVYKSNTDIVISGMTTSKLVEVFSINGSKIFSKVMQNGSIPTLTRGVYVVKIEGFTTKVII